jgi:hypothetical protein
MRDCNLTDAHANIKLGELFVGRVGAQRFPIFRVAPFPFCQDDSPGVGWFNSVKRNPIGGMGGWIN